MTAKKRTRTPQQRIEFLMRHRRKVAMTKWDALTPMFGSTHEQILVERDAELMAAIAAWQQRRLAEIDAQLRKLGIANPEALQDDLETLAEDHRPSRLDMIEAVLRGKCEPEYSMVILGGCAN